MTLGRDCKNTVSFKPGSSLNVTPMLYFELRFPMFIIKGYDSKANACSPWTSCWGGVKRKQGKKRGKVRNQINISTSHLPHTFNLSITKLICAEVV